MQHIGVAYRCTQHIDRVKHRPSRQREYSELLADNNENRSNQNRDYVTGLIEIVVLLMLMPVCSDQSSGGQKPEARRRYDVQCVVCTLWMRQRQIDALSALILSMNTQFRMNIFAIYFLLFSFHFFFASIHDEKIIEEICRRKKKNRQPNSGQMECK